LATKTKRNVKEEFSFPGKYRPLDGEFLSHLRKALSATYGFFQVPREMTLTWSANKVFGGASFSRVITEFQWMPAKPKIMMEILGPVHFQTEGKETLEQSNFRGTFQSGPYPVDSLP
jgi:hypothetical protein